MYLASLFAEIIILVSLSVMWKKGWGGMGWGGGFGEFPEMVRWWGREGERCRGVVVSCGALVVLLLKR